MNISTMIEQLATYRDEIVNILQSLDGLNIEIGTKIDELEKERDERVVQYRPKNFQPNIIQIV